MAAGTAAATWSGMRASSVALAVSFMLACGCSAGPVTELSSLSDRQLHVGVDATEADGDSVVEISVTSKDARSGCLRLDPDTEVSVGRKRFSLGTPSSPDDGCAPVSLVVDLRDDHLDPSSPTTIRIADASLALEMTVSELLAERRIAAPGTLDTCSMLTLAYSPVSDVVVPAETELSFFAPPDSAGRYAVDANLGMFASAASGGEMVFAIPYGSPGAPPLSGTAELAVAIAPIVQDCRGATACDARLRVHAQAAAVLRDGCQ
jgi:hypothetical protein